MNVEARFKGRLSNRHVAGGQMRALGRSGSYDARRVGSRRALGDATVVGGARIVITAVGRSSDINLICARCPDRKTEWRIGATNPTSDEHTKFARQFGQPFSDVPTDTGEMYEKLRYADG